jgi:2-dehydropantoate 2-reductase
MLDDKGKIAEFRGAKDARLKGRVFGDEKAENAVVYVHGLEGHGEWFCEVASALAARGIAVYLPDRRGAGLNREGRGDWRHLQTLVDDLVRFIDLIQNRHRFVHLVGHSWGGKFALYFAIRRQFMVHSLALIAPTLSSKVDVGVFTRFRAGLALVMKRNPLFHTPIKAWMLTRNPEALAYVALDPMRLRRATARFYLNSLEMERYLGENADGLRAPVRIFLAGDDAVVDNDGVREEARRFHSRKVEITEYAGAAHGLFFERPKELAEDLAAWVVGGWRGTLERRKILVAGAGAVGSVVGGLLGIGGHEVTLLARESHAGPIERRGLVMGLCTVKRVAKEIKAVTNLDGVGEQDIVIVSAKSYDTAAIAGQVARICGPKTAVVSLQNGVANEEILARALPESKIAGGAILGYFSVPEPGTCLIAHDRGGIMLAPYARMTIEEAEMLRDILSDSGMIVRVHGNCDEVKWSKLLLNVSFSALSAITSVPVEIILMNKALFVLSRRMVRECVAVMKRLGIEAIDLPGYKVRNLVKAVTKPKFLLRPFRKVEASESGGMSSMWQDLRKGNGRTEIDFINGMVARRGKECGVATPANAHVTRLVKSLASGEKPMDTYARNLGLVYRIRE